MSRSTGEQYYVHVATGESTYNRPAPTVDCEDVEAATPSSDAAAAELPPGWEVAVSRSTGEQYYVHVATGESTYERPNSVPIINNTLVNPVSSAPSSAAFRRYQNSEGEMGRNEVKKMLASLGCALDDDILIESIMGTFGQKKGPKVVVTVQEFPSLWAHLGQQCTANVPSERPEVQPAGNTALRNGPRQAARVNTMKNDPKMLLAKLRHKPLSWWKVKRGLSKQEATEVRKAMLTKERQAMQDAIEDELAALIRCKKVAAYQREGAMGSPSSGLQCSDEALPRTIDCATTQQPCLGDASTQSSEVSAGLNLADVPKTTSSENVPGCGDSVPAHLRKQNVEYMLGAATVPLPHDQNKTLSGGSNPDNTATPKKRYERSGSRAPRVGSSAVDGKLESGRSSKQADLAKEHHGASSVPASRNPALPMKTAAAHDSVQPMNSAMALTAPRIRRSSVSSIASSATSSASLSNRRRARALFTFDAIESGDLGFQKNAIVCVTRCNPSKSWWRGFVENDTSKARGHFPAACKCVRLSVLISPV